MTNTTRLGLTYPVSSATADVPADMGVLAGQLDVLTLAYASGTFAARPAASAIAGKIYWATDYKRSYISDGTSWYDIQPPVGQVCPFPMATPPDATWLICDGSSQLRATYAALFGLLGSTYGSVDATHFTLPDLRGRTVFGTDAGAGRVVTDPHAIGNTGGVERYTLLSAEAAQKAVSTNVDAGAHVHAPGGGGSWLTNGTGTGANVTTGGGGYALDPSLSNPGNHGHAIAGSSAASSHENMPPYITLSYIIKT